MGQGKVCSAAKIRGNQSNIWPGDRWPCSNTPVRLAYGLVQLWIESNSQSEQGVSLSGAPIGTCSRGL